MGGHQAPRLPVTSMARRSSLRSLFDDALELAGFEQFHDDVAAADQLAVDEQLREGGQIGEARQIGADLRLFQHIDRAQCDGACGHQGLHGAAGIAAHGVLRGALHEQHERVTIHLGLDLLHYRHTSLLASPDEPTAMVG
ncbi:hypothetical protein BN1263170052 [Stenotrophomonas indicatrix]|nr:hypothetical protein BN1263170052 [Stenotrophomonas indicatrix]